MNSEARKHYILVQSETIDVEAVPDLTLPWWIVGHMDGQTLIAVAVSSGEVEAAVEGDNEIRVQIFAVDDKALSKGST